MICVGIDVAKDKHDCFILSSEGEVLADVFTISNNAEGFDTLLQTIHRCARPEDKKKKDLRQLDITATTFSDFCLTKVCTPLLSILCTPTFTERASASAKRRQTVSMREPCGPQVLHRHSIPQRRTKITHKIQVRQSKGASKAEAVSFPIGHHSVS